MNALKLGGTMNGDYKGSNTWHKTGGAHKWMDSRTVAKEEIHVLERTNQSRDLNPICNVVARSEEGLWILS